MTEIKVSQRAREAGADRFDAAFGPSDLSREMRQGLHDCDPMIQAFARFEQAIRADEMERAAKVLDGKSDTLAGLSLHSRRGNSASILRAKAELLREQAAAIRAQGDEA